MLTLKEYEGIARKLLISSFKPIAYSIIKDNDKFGQIVTELAMADFKFDGRGTKEGYRKQRVSWIIRKIFDQKIPTVPLERIKKQLVCTSDDVVGEVEFLDSFELLCDKIKNNNTLTQKEQMCAEGYFIQKLDMEDLAESFGLKKHTVKNYIKNAVTKLGVYEENIKRLRDRNIRGEYSKRSTRKNGL